MNGKHEEPHLAVLFLSDGLIELLGSASTLKPLNGCFHPA